MILTDCCCCCYTNLTDGIYLFIPHIVGAHYRIYISAMKEIPQDPLKNHVYLVPDHVAIYPVAYNLPKSESYMRRDVLR